VFKISNDLDVRLRLVGGSVRNDARRSKKACYLGRWIISDVRISGEKMSELLGAVSIIYCLDCELLLLMGIPARDSIDVTRTR
jgi:hypothetical protein